MNLGIGGDADLEIGDALQARDEIDGTRIARGMRFIAPGARGRVTAQRDDVANAGVPIIAARPR